MNNNRIGIIGSSPLIQHQMQFVVAEAGYKVVVNSSPELVAPEVFSDKTISLWIFELEDGGQWTEFVQDVIDRISVPVLFGNANIPDRTDPTYPAWSKKIYQKLQSLAPIVDLRSIESAVAISDSEQPTHRMKAMPSPSMASSTSVWVLCASAGGPEAVKQFLDELPKNISATFLYAQHIDDDCVDTLIQAMSRKSELVICHASDGFPMANGQVAIVPVNCEITIDDQMNVRWKNKPWRGPYGPSHDQLLENISRHCGSEANSIVFSGMGSDGALGALKIKEKGGIVWSQSSQTCIQSSMPDAVAQLGAADWRGSPAEMAHRLIDCLAQKNLEAAVG